MAMARNASRFFFYKVDSKISQFLERQRPLQHGGRVLPSDPRKRGSSAGHPALLQDGAGAGAPLPRMRDRVISAALVAPVLKT